jgi:hypothetical protein
VLEECHFCQAKALECVKDWHSVWHCPCGAFGTFAGYGDKDEALGIFDEVVESMLQLEPGKAIAFESRGFVFEQVHRPDERGWEYWLKPPEGSPSSATTHRARVRREHEAHVAQKQAQAAEEGPLREALKQAHEEVERVFDDVNRATNEAELEQAHKRRRAAQKAKDQIVARLSELLNSG